MKLGALLAAGKSLALGRNGESPYRADKQIYLPKFASPKNLFIAAGEAEATERAAKIAVTAPVIKEVAAKTQKLPTLPETVNGQTVAAVNPALPVRAARRSVSWMDKLNPFGTRHAPPVPALKNAKVPLQAELSLDAVKVLRNDLSDVDVEVVPLKSRPPRDPAVPDLEPAKKSWEVLGERLFKMETT